MGDISRVILLMIFLLNKGEFCEAGTTKNKRVEFLPVGMKKQGIVRAEFYPRTAFSTLENMSFEGHEVSI